MVVSAKSQLAEPRNDIQLDSQISFDLQIMIIVDSQRQLWKPVRADMLEAQSLGPGARMSVCPPSKSLKAGLDEKLRAS
jgi:hypothetical protein